MEREAIEQIFGEDMTQLLQTGRCQLLITTLGGDGSRCYYQRDGRVEETYVPICSCGDPVVDTTGSGDGYVAGFL